MILEPRPTCSGGIEGWIRLLGRFRFLRLFQMFKSFLRKDPQKKKEKKLVRMMRRPPVKKIVTGVETRLRTGLILFVSVVGIDMLKTVELKRSY